MSSTALVIDTETTRIESPEVVEVAWHRIQLDGSVVERYLERFRPEGDISWPAIATHHIFPEDLEDCAPSSSFVLPEGTEYIVGHNVDFDWKAIGSPTVKRVCTLALARYTWPDIDGHTLGALIYMLRGKVFRETVMNAHSAEIDVQLTRVLLDELIKRHWPDSGFESFEELWALSEVARVPTMMHFGKHKGKPISKVPADYKAWLLRQPDVDPYLAQALQGKL